MIDYQTALICSCLRDEDVLVSCRGKRIKPEAFSNPNAAILYDALCKNMDDGQEFSSVELWMRIRRDHPQKVDAVAEWVENHKGMVPSTGWEKWAESVAIEYRENLKKNAMDKAFEMVAEGQAISDVVSYLTTSIHDADDAVSLEEDRLKLQREQVMERIRNRITGQGDIVPTGIPMLDSQFGAMQGHEFIVLAARPGCGKSSLARQIMLEHIKNQKKPVMMFSLEMSTDQVVQSFASMNSGISSWRIEDDFSERQERLIKETERFAGALGTFFFIHDDHYKITDIENAIHFAARRHKPSMIILDYLQLVEPPTTKGMNREQQVAYMSRRFKQLALQYRIPIIALAQMSRGYEKENRKPRLSDLRESGSLEQDADRVWFLHNEPDAQPIGNVFPVELIQAKCRGGSEKLLDIGFQKTITKFIFNPLIKDNELS